MSNSLNLIREAKLSLENLETLISSLDDTQLIQKIESKLREKFIQLVNSIKNCQTDIIEMTQEASKSTKVG